MAVCRVKMLVHNFSFVSLSTGIFKTWAPPAKTKLLLVKFELGSLHICWKFSDP